MDYYYYIPPAWRRGVCASVCGSIDGIQIVSIIIIGVGVGVGNGIVLGGGSSGPNRSARGSNIMVVPLGSRAGCIASTSGTNTTANVLARASHSCSVRTSWVGGGSTAIQNYVYCV